MYNTHSAWELVNIMEITTLFSKIFMYVTSLSLLCLYFHLYVGRALLEYTVMGKSLYIVVQWSPEGKCYMCVFCKKSCYKVCLLTESLNQRQRPQGTTGDHLSNPVILKPKCATECLENLLKTLLPGLHPRPTESISSGRGVRDRNTYFNSFLRWFLCQSRTALGDPYIFYLQVKKHHSEISWAW